MRREESVHSAPAEELSHASRAEVPTERPSRPKVRLLQSMWVRSFWGAFCLDAARAWSHGVSEVLLTRLQPRAPQLVPPFLPPAYISVEVHPPRKHAPCSSAHGLSRPPAPRSHHPRPGCSPPPLRSLHGPLVQPEAPTGAPQHLLTVDAHCCLGSLASTCGPGFLLPLDLILPETGQVSVPPTRLT